MELTFRSMGTFHRVKLECFILCAEHYGEYVITHSSCSLIILVNSPSGREVIPFEDKYLKKNQVIKLSEKVYNGHIPCEFSLCDTRVIRSKISSSSDFMIKYHMKSCLYAVAFFPSWAKELKLMRPLSHDDRRRTLLLEDDWWYSMEVITSWKTRQSL